MCGINQVKPYANELISYCGEKFGLKSPPKLFFAADEQNAKNPLGRTAHYDPVEKSITVFVTGRHIKDVLRSLAHELVHHVQNLRGDLSSEKCGEMSTTYAQDNPHMRNMEKEAYLVGNITFRDWENTRNLKENKIMGKTTENKIRELIRKIISEKMAYKREDDEETSERVKKEDEETSKRVAAWDKETSEKVKEKDEETSEKVEENTEEETLEEQLEEETLEEEAEEQLEEAFKEETLEEESEEIIENDVEELTKIQTPEQEQSIYESRFTNRNNKLFERLLKSWTK